MDQHPLPQPGLIDLLREPARVTALAEDGWNGIVARGTATQLLGQLHAALARADALGAVPHAVRRHLALAALTSQRRREAALWELETMRRAIRPEVPMVVLKGCAYALAGDVNATGRLFSDMDILVAREFLESTEGDLLAGGWRPGVVDLYDQRYYREWMHEVPPMEHMRRHTTIDLHHAINPPVSRYHVPMAPLLEARVEIRPGVFVLSAVDRVLHCALHAVQEGETRKLLRDLYDLHLLVRQHFAGEAGLAPLWARAEELGVLPLVRAAVQACAAAFDPAQSRLQPSGWLAHGLAVGSGWRQRLLAEPLAGALILAHSHWIKMPLKMLVPHLLHKANLKRRGDTT